MSGGVEGGTGRRRWRDVGKMWAEVLNMFMVINQRKGAACCHGDRAGGKVR